MSDTDTSKAVSCVILGHDYTSEAPTGLSWNKCYRCNALRSPQDITLSAAQVKIDGTILTTDPGP